MIKQREVLTHILNNDNSLLLDSENKPIPKIFTEVEWENIKYFTSPKFKFVKFIDNAPTIKKSNIKVEVISPNVDKTIKPTVEGNFDPPTPPTPKKKKGNKKKKRK